MYYEILHEPNLSLMRRFLTSSPGIIIKPDIVTTFVKQTIEAHSSHIKKSPMMTASFLRAFSYSLFKESNLQAFIFFSKVSNK